MTESLFDDLSDEMMLTAESQLLVVMSGLAIRLNEVLNTDLAHSALMMLDEQFPSFRDAMAVWLAAPTDRLGDYAYDLYYALRRYLEIRGLDTEFRQWGAAITRANAEAIDEDVLERIAPFIGEDGLPVLFAESTLDRLTAGELSDFAEMYNLVGVLRINHEPPERILPFFAEALRLKQRAGDGFGVVGVLLNFSQLAYWEDDMAAALDYSEAAYDVAAASGDVTLQGQVAHHLASFLDAANQLDRAAALYEQHLTLLDEIGETEERTQMMFTYALNCDRRGLKRQALELATASLALMNAENDPHAEYLRAWVRQLQEETSGS